MLAWRPDSRELACAEYMGRTVHLWDSQTGSHSGSMTEIDRPITTLAYSPDGSHLATVLAGDITTPTAPTFIVWDVAGRKVLKRLTVPAAMPPQLTANLIYGSDGSYVAISMVQLRRTILFDPSRSAVKAEVPTPSNTGAMQMDPGGHVLAYASHDPQEGYPLKIVRLSDGATVTGDVRHTQASRALAFDPSGRHVAVGDTDGAVTLYEARSGRMVRRLQRHEHDVFSVRFHPRGEHLLSVSSDGLRVWDVKTGTQLRHCRLGSAMHHVFAISPDAHSVATVGRDELKLWDTCPESTNPVR